MSPVDSQSVGAGSALSRGANPRRPVVLGLAAVLLPRAAPLLVLGIWALASDDAKGLPSYTVELACEACSPQAVPRLDPLSVLDLTLRPSRRVSGPVAVHAAVLYDTGIEPWPVHFADSPAGTFRLRAPVQALPNLRPGLRQLVFLIEPRQAHSPNFTGSLETSPAVQVLRQPLGINP